MAWDWYLYSVFGYLWRLACTGCWQREAWHAVEPTGVILGKLSQDLPRHVQASAWLAQTLTCLLIGCSSATQGDDRIQGLSCKCCLELKFETAGMSDQLPSLAVHVAVQDFILNRVSLTAELVNTARQAVSISIA
jgi:hypothetical protein